MLDWGVKYLSALLSLDLLLVESCLSLLLSPGCSCPRSFCPLGSCCPGSFRTGCSCCGSSLPLDFVLFCLLLPPPGCCLFCFCLLGLLFPAPIIIQITMLSGIWHILCTVSPFNALVIPLNAHAIVGDPMKIQSAWTGWL